MAASKKEQRAEAVKRLESLVEMGMNPEVLEDFEKGVICFSRRDNARPGEAVVSPIDTSPFSSLVNGFERKHDRLVYHAMLKSMPFGSVLHLLSVSRYEDDLEGAMCDLATRCPLAYGANFG